MKTQLVFEELPALSTELLTIFAVDIATDAATDATEADAKPQPMLLTISAEVIASAAAVLASGEFKASANETLLIHAPAGLAAKRLLVVGLGKAAKLTAHSVRNAAGTAIRFAKPRNISEVTLSLPFHPNTGHPVTAPEFARAAVEGAFVGDFDPDTYRSDRKDRSIKSLTIVGGLGPQSEQRKAYTEGVILGESQNFTRSLINEPGNKLTPTILGERAIEMAYECGLKCEVHSTGKLEELQMGAFLSVAQGSEEPPALIVLSYEPDSAIPISPVIGLVGKGVTFDTGGISLKPADNMEKMKYDMAGAGAMLGAMRAISQLKPGVKVVAVICSTENMPDGRAQKPGDVQTAMPLSADKPGKTIEIINTDAEGRLVLADGITYARQLGATHLIDAATLTGAVAVALGQVNAGVFSNDDATFGHFTKALTVSGEKFWRLPLDEGYADQIRSDIADIKNTGGRYGGASTAAEFLKVFAGDTPWVHLDIAGLAWNDENKPWISKGPSGVGVRSITEWVRSLAGE